MAMDAAELGRWMRFAAKGGIGRCVAVRDCEAQKVGDLMFFEGDEIIVLHQVPSSNDTSGGDQGKSGGVQFLGYCEEIVGRFNARDVRFTTKLKKAVMTKRVSSSSSSPATPTVPASVSASTSSSSPIPGIRASDSTSHSPSVSALSPSPSTSSTLYTASGLSSSPRASPAPSTYSTTSSSTLGIHEPRAGPSSGAQIPKSGMGLGMSGGVSDSLERRSSGAGSARATRTASPLQRSYTSPVPSSSVPYATPASTFTASPTTSSFVSFSPTPSSATPSPKEAVFSSSALTGSAFAAPDPSPALAQHPARSMSYSTSARNSPSPATSPALQHSRSLGSTSASSSASGSPFSSPIPQSPSPRMVAQPLQPHSQQQHRYTAHAPSPLSFASASALSQRVSSSSSSFSRASAYSTSNSRSSSGGTPTSPAFSATGTLSPASPSFSTSSLSMSPGGRDGWTPTASNMTGSLTPTGAGTNPLRITKRSPSLGHASVHSVIPGLRSPPPVSPLPELPTVAGGGSASSRGSETDFGSYAHGPTHDPSTGSRGSSWNETSISISSSIMPGVPSASDVTQASSSPSVLPPTLTSLHTSPAASSSQPSTLHAAPIPPALNLPSTADPTPPSPSVAPPTASTSSSTGSPMNSAYAARMAFTPLPSSVGGFGAIAGRVEDQPLSSTTATTFAQDGLLKEEGRVGGEEARVVTAHAEVLPPEEKAAETANNTQAPSTTAMSTTNATSNDIGLSLLQLQDLADGMYSYGSDSDSDSGSNYSRNSFAGVTAHAGGFGSGLTSRAASRSDGKVVDGVGVVDRNGRRRSMAPGASGSAGQRATLRAGTLDSPATVGGTEGDEDVGSEDGTVEGVAYYSIDTDNDSKERKAGGGKGDEGDAEAKALLAKMEAMNAMVAAMPTFPTKPSPGVVARSAVASSSAGGSSLSAGSAGGAGSAAHLSPTSPTFPQDPSERERRPSLASAYSSRSVRSARSGTSGASGTTSGSGEDYDIYDSYRYSRYSVLSGRSGTSQAHTISSPPRVGGRRMDSMGSVDESHEVGVEKGPRARGLDMVLDELSFGDEGARDGDATPSGDGRGAYGGGGLAHERTMSIDSEASVYTQDSSEQVKGIALGASTGSNNSGMSTVAGAHVATTTSRPAPLDLSKETSAPIKSVTSPLLHTSWGSATSSAKSSAAPFDVHAASFGVQAHSLVGAMGVERAGEVKSARAEVEERVTSPVLGAVVQQGIEDGREGEEGDRTVSTIVDGVGLGKRIVVEDDEELPSRIEDDGLDMDDTMTSINTRRSSMSGSPDPASNIFRGLAPALVVTNRTPSPVDVDNDPSTAVPAAVPAAVPRPPRSAGLSPFAASNQRRSIFLPHPGAPKAPSQVDHDDVEHQLAYTSASAEPAAWSAWSPPPHGAKQIPMAHQHPLTHSHTVPILRPNWFQTFQMSLTTPPRPPPPILLGMVLPPAPLMKGPTIYGRTDVDLSAAVGPVPISWSIDPFPIPPKTGGNPGKGNVKSKNAGAVAGQGQALPPVGVGRGYPTRSMSMGANLGAGPVPSTSSPLAKSASMAASTPPPPPVIHPPAPSVAASTSLVPAPSEPPSTVTDGGGTGAAGALPRANFTPHAPGLRPRSRSFSGFNSVSSGSSGPINVIPSHEAPFASIRATNSSSVPPPRLSSASSTTTLASSPSIGHLSASSSLTTASSSTSVTSFASTPTSKPPIPTAPKPTPKPPSTLTSKKPNSLSLRSSPLSTSLSVGGGLKSPKTPSSPLAMNVVVAQRDSVVDTSDVREGAAGNEDDMAGPDPRQMRLRAMGSMPNLGSSTSSSSTSFSSSLSPPPKSPSPLSTGSGTSRDFDSNTGATRIASGGTKEDTIDAGVRSMTSPISTREPMSPPPFATLPLRVPPPQQLQHSQGPSSQLLPEPKSPVSPSVQQGAFFSSENHSSTQVYAKPQRQPSLRNKLSLPNLRRKHSRPDEDDMDRERDMRGQPSLLNRARDTQPRGQRERDDTLDVERERELLQVHDLEFELVRPSLPAAQREWGAARTSEDSGVLGRDTGSLDYSNSTGVGPFRGGDATSRGSFESRGSFDMRGNGTGPGGERTEGSRLRPTSPAFSVASGAPSSVSLSRQRSPTIDAAWPSNSESPTIPGASNPAEIEAHRAREQRWLTLLASSPSSAGAAAYTLPPPSMSASNTSSHASSAAPSSGSPATYTPNPLAKSRKTRKLLIESSVPSSVRFRVWVFLTDARARAVPGVYNALVARGVGRVKDGVIGDIRRDVRGECDRLGIRATSPSLASRSSVSHIDDSTEDESLAAAKPFMSSIGGDAPVTILLLAYLNMVPDIAYSRGLIHVLGHLLLLSPDEDAFWIFVSVMDSWLRGYFVVLPGTGIFDSGTAGATIPVAPQMDVDALLFTRALESNEPQVAKRLLVDVGLSGVAICGPWLSGVFVGALPVDHLNRVWDLFLFEGIPWLIRVAIALISCLKRQLLAPLPLASSISASASLSPSMPSSQSPHATTLLSLLHRPPAAALPPSPDAFVSMALAVKLKDDDIRKQRVKMEQQVSLRMRQQQQASSSSSLAPPGHRPGSLRGSFQALRAGGSVISLPRAVS